MKTVAVTVLSARWMLRPLGSVRLLDEIESAGGSLHSAMLCDVGIECN